MAKSNFQTNNPLKKLNPFLDEDGQLRVGGRLRRADLDLGGGHPILLSKNSHVSRLIATYFHESIQHQGRHMTTGAVRSGGFWILGVHSLVRSIIDKCTICKRLRAKPITQQMADLPKDRMETSPPFTNVGTDVFGPWTIVTRLPGEVLQTPKGEHKLTHEVLVTFMAEAVAIVNSLPISSISSDANDPAPLTPNMLLTQKTSPLQPFTDEFTRQDFYGRKRWRQVQYLADQFWLRWRKDYLQSLQPCQKWLHPQENLSTGDVVLLKEKDVVRGSWSLARVVRTLESEDGKVRKVDVLVCAEGTRRNFTRPISDLILIDKVKVEDARLDSVRAWTEYCATPRWGRVALFWVTSTLPNIYVTMKASDG
ncbi:hypothetical protein HOLleu_16634 [Holothuria leucospilota]|uniref:DUF5641 domain-containing protein n=1 Tax=Holothuria leucospilota TaxID=206669 RepID=A0A9Q1HBC2_HOLLE|nr:hypothetical protein HOLleu_16634 [Holothuria leucospilota]